MSVRILNVFHPGTNIPAPLRAVFNRGFACRLEGGNTLFTVFSRSDDPKALNLRGLAIINARGEANTLLDIGHQVVFKPEEIKKSVSNNPDCLKEIAKYMHLNPATGLWHIIDTNSLLKMYDSSWQPKYEALKNLVRSHMRVLYRNRWSPIKDQQGFAELWLEAAKFAEKNHEYFVGEQQKELKRHFMRSAESYAPILKLMREGGIVQVNTADDVVLSFSDGAAQGLIALPPDFWIEAAAKPAQSAAPAPVRAPEKMDARQLLIKKLPGGTAHTPDILIDYYLKLIAKGVLQSDWDVSRQISFLIDDEQVAAVVPAKRYRDIQYKISIDQTVVENHINWHAVMAALYNPDNIELINCGGQNISASFARLALQDEKLASHINLSITLADITDKEGKINQNQLVVIYNVAERTVPKRVFAGRIHKSKIAMFEGCESLFVDDPQDRDYVWPSDDAIEIIQATINAAQKDHSYYQIAKQARTIRDTILFRYCKVEDKPVVVPAHSIVFRIKNVPVLSGTATEQEVENVINPPSPARRWPSYR